MIDLNVNAELLRAQTLLRGGEVVHALRILEGLQKRNPKSTAVLSLLSKATMEQGRLDDAAKYMQKCIDLEPGVAAHHVAFASVLTNMGQHRQAVTRLEKARRHAPNDSYILACLADAQEMAGEPDRACELLEPLLRSGHENAYHATIWARIALARNEPEEGFRVMERHAAEDDPRNPGSFWFTFGQVCDRTNRVEQAFAAYSRGHALSRARFDLDAHIQLYDRILRCFNRATLRRLPRPAHNTSGPVFVAGRPRSGTTLVEKILDAHPAVTGVGEILHLSAMVDNLGFEIGSTLTYPDAIRDLDADDITRLSKGYLDHVQRLAGTAVRIVDKNLENYQSLGMIQVLFPDARAIHIRRSALDNCWAIFAADLSHVWAHDLRTLGATHALYERLMAHWREVLDLPLLEIDYEALVEDQKGWTRRMIEFSGLPWDDRCLRYYETSAKTKENVSAPTLSYNQVRQPIYKTAVGRAQKFEAFLQPLRDGLEEGRRVAASLGR